MGDPINSQGGGKYYEIRTYLQVGRARCQRVEEPGVGGCPGGRYPDLLVAPELPGRVEPGVCRPAVYFVVRWVHKT